MKTAVLLTNSAQTQSLLSELIGSHTNFILLQPPAVSSRVAYDALFAPWLRMIDAVILDAATLNESTHSAIESLSAATLQEHQAVVVRLTAQQRFLFPLKPGWLVVADTDTPEQLQQSIGAHFELRQTKAKLKRADAVIARHVKTAATPGPRSTVTGQRPAIVPASDGVSFDVYRYRDALKKLSRILSQRPSEQELLAEFLELVREFLRVGRLAILTRKFESDIFTGSSGPTGNQFVVAARVGIGQQTADLVQLSLDAGIGGCLARDAQILRRAALADPMSLEYDEQIAREFELLAAEVAVPILDCDQLLGVLVVNGKITGEQLANEELELVYQLMTHLAQAIRNLHLQNQVAGQQRFMSEVLANVQSGVVVAGADGRILSLTERARVLLDLPAGQYVGQNLRLLPGHIADMLFNVLQTGREVAQQEITLPRNNRPLSVSARRFLPAGVPAAMADAAGNFAVALLDDLTEVKRQELQARALRDQEFFSRLSFRLSHELKNALVSVKIFAQLLPERYAEKEFREQFSNVVVKEVNRVTMLVNNLTFFSQPLSLVGEELALNDLIDACLANVAQEISAKQIALFTGLGERTPEKTTLPAIAVKRNFAHTHAAISGDKIRLTQAFEHVLRNAVQAMPNGGRLTVNTSNASASSFPAGKLPEGGAVKIEWMDTGEGIPPELAPHVTEPFVTTRNVGVGLGLTIVKKIVERHGGHLEINSTPGSGTTMVMVLPVETQRHPDDEIVLGKYTPEGKMERNLGEVAFPKSE